MATNPNQLIGIATTLQNKVGTALTSAQTLLPAADYQSAVMQAGATGIVANVLISINQGQKHLLKLTSNISGLLQSQVDIANDAARREADRLAEELKEKNKLKGLVKGSGDGEPGANLTAAGTGMGAWFMNLLSKAGLPLLTAGGAALFFKGLARKLLKGGIYGFIASQVAKPLINFIEDGVLKIEIAEEDELILEDAIVAAVTAAAIFGPKGALVALVAVGLKSIYDTLTDPNKSIKDVSMTSWLTTIVPAVTLLGIQYLSIGAMIAAAPYILAVAIAAGIGLGLKWLYDKSQEISDDYLNHLQDLTSDSDIEFKERLANSKKQWKERWFGERIAALLDSDSLSVTGKMGLASDKGVKNAKSIMKEGGDVTEALTTEGAVGLKNVSDMLTKFSDQEIQDMVLNDKGKMLDILRTMNNIRDLAVMGAFGPDSKAIAKAGFEFNDRVKDVAGEMIAAGTQKHKYVQFVAGGASSFPIDNDMSISEYQIDVLGKIGEVEKALKEKQLEEAKIKSDLAKKQLELIAAKEGDERHGFFKFFNDPAYIDKIQKEISMLQSREHNVSQFITGYQKQLEKGEMFAGTNLTWELLKKHFTKSELDLMIRNSLLPIAEKLKIKEDETNSVGHFLSQSNIKTENKSLKNIQMTDSHLFHKSDEYLSVAHVALRL